MRTEKPKPKGKGKPELPIVHCGGESNHTAHSWEVLTKNGKWETYRCKGTHLSVAELKARLAAMIPKPSQSSGEHPCVRRKGESGHFPAPAMNANPTKPTVTWEEMFREQSEFASKLATQLNEAMATLKRISALTWSERETRVRLSMIKAEADMAIKAWSNSEGGAK